MHTTLLDGTNHRDMPVTGVPVHDLESGLAFCPWPPFSSTHRRTVLRESDRIHARRQRFSRRFWIAACSFLLFNRPSGGFVPHTDQSEVTRPQQDHMSSYVASNSTHQLSGKGMRKMRVQSSIEAHART